MMKIMWLGALLAIAGCMGETYSENTSPASRDAGGGDARDGAVEGTRDAGPSCSSDQRSCEGQCVDPQSDARNCGACGRACASAESCVMGACRVLCPTGQSACGVECVDSRSNASHCGACGRACAAGEGCVAGTCVSGCPAPRAVCGGVCTDLEVSAANCGACGRGCASGQRCVAGRCDVSCASGTQSCGGACVDTSRDSNHCGGCGRACPASQSCIAGACQTGCAAGQTACGGVCTSLQTDGRNCGACGMVCSATQRCTAGACVATASSIRVVWTFPGLWSVPGSPDSWLPTYVTHLMGATPPVVHPVRLELACANVTNSGMTEQRVDVELRVPSLADPRMQSVTVAAGATREVCVTPAFNAVLRSLRAEQPGTIEVYARLADGTEVARGMRGFTATPGNAVLWGAVATRAEMGQLASVFVTPNDTTVLSLRPAVERRSIFPGGFGGGSPFERAPYYRNQSIGVGQHAVESVYLRSGNVVSWAVSSVSGGSGADIDVYAFTADQYVGWRDRNATVALAVSRDQLSGARGSFTAPADGWYRLVLFNTTDNFLSRTVQWTRSVTYYDVARDALQAIFNELRARGLSYTNLGTSYWDGWQRIRRPAESLTMRSANCIDGALLFASILEGAGLPAELFLVPGHAYVGVRMGPTADAPILPIETTMVGGTQTADQAIDCSLGDCPGDVATPRYIIDVTNARAAGIRPIPIL